MRDRRVPLLLTVLMLMTLLPGGAASSQAPASCPQIVQLALDTTDQVCSGVGENQACYGHVLVDAIPRFGVEDFQFNSQGDIAKLFDLQTLRLSPMDVGLGTWGVALISMQAYLKYAMPENVTFLLFGDVEIEDAQEPLTSLQVVVHARDYVNARIMPDQQAGVLEALIPGQTLTAQGRTADSSWVRVVLPGSRRVGWLHHTVLRVDGDLEGLRVVAEESDYFGPMQAFYFRSGSADAYCPESPESGLLVQTPEGVAEVTLLINEVSIAMQATAFLQAQPGGEMTVGVVDGWAEVQANGQRQPVFAGTQVSIPMGSTLQASGPPSEPKPYQFARLQALPLGMLTTPVTLPDPLPETEIAMRMNIWRAQDSIVYGQALSAQQDILYFTDEGKPVVMGDDGVLVVMGDDGVSVVAAGVIIYDAEGTPLDPAGLPGLDGELPPESGEGTPPEQEQDLPPVPESDLPPGLDEGPPGLDGVLPPGMGGENPGVGDGVPPGQAKKDLPPVE